MRLTVFLPLLAAALLVGCGSESDPAVVTQTVVQQAPEAATSTESDSAPEPEPEPEPEPKAAPTKITVPDVVGDNHQDAQDRMQAEGLFNLREKDATGLERILVLDSNWEVVSQKPTAGKRVSENAIVTLSSKKIGE